MADREEPVAESPDLLGAYPRLTSEQLRMIDRFGTRRTAARHEVLVPTGARDYDLFVVRSGLAVAVTGRRGDKRLVSAHGPGRFLGELSLINGEPAALTLLMNDPGELAVVPHDRITALFAAYPELDQLISRALLLRRGLLLGAGQDSQDAAAAR